MVKVSKNRFRRKQFFPSFKAYNKCIHTERSGATENFPLQFERKHSLDLCIKDVNNNKGLFNVCENDVIVTLQTRRGGQEKILRLWRRPLYTAPFPYSMEYGSFC